MTLLLALACSPESHDLRVEPHAFGSTDFEQTEPPIPPTTHTTPGTTGGTTTPGTTTTPVPVGDEGPLGFVGSPCESDADCDYDGGVCLRDDQGFPRGTCSAPCDRTCDDAAGYPTTFCTDVDELPADVASLGAGGCLSRCNFQIHPVTGCRDDYGCVETSRPDGSGSTYTCVPNEPSSLPACLQDLAGRGVPFEPTIIDDAHPSEDPSLTCHVEDPVKMFSGYLGVDITYYDGATGGSINGACSLAHAVADTIEDVADDGVVRLRHLGTYNCRLIAGSSSLSRHGYGDAIDIYGFDFDDGTAWTLVDDWEHDTTTFSTEAGEWLYDTSHGWHDQRLWNVILTPNYNSAHDNHFHVDLTPGSDFIGLLGPYFGPSPWDGE
ncbi:MAG: extensin family protein [Alphaproteobacteria bacterium]|nr:extensin family protein [Alphaproteobacteria bacterium]